MVRTYCNNRRRSQKFSVLLTVLRTRFNLIPLQRQRTVLASKSRINTARITQFLSRLTASPDRSLTSLAVRTLGASRILRVQDFFGLIPVQIGVNKFLWSKFIPLLKIKPYSSMSKSKNNGDVENYRKHCRVS